jgi:preprotein translocase subunit YajC
MSLLGATLLQILPLGVVFAILYFFFIRPQKRQADAHKTMLRDLRPGDRVLTEGGLYARVLELIGETDLLLEFSPTMQLKATRLAISEVVEKVPVPVSQVARPDEAVTAGDA